MPAQTIIYQGEPGANSHLACIDAYPNAAPIPAHTFEDVFSAVEKGKADLAMIPIENSVAGRVADIHLLLPHSELFVVGEHFERVRHQLLAIKGTKLEDLKTVHSHTMALGQCRKQIRELGLTPIPEADTAGSARMIKENGDKTQAAIASKLAAEIHDLEVIKADIEDADHNTTRFLILANEKAEVAPNSSKVMTSFIFQVRNVPAALYKALGGFATNSVNMTKLESYQLGGSFNATMFYADIEGHPSDRPVELAMEELAFFAKVRILGTYKAHEYRNREKLQDQN